MRTASLITIVVVFVIAAPVAASSANHLLKILQGEQNTAWQVAQNLGRFGVKPGDHVGRIGGTYDVRARLLGVTVVAEVPGAN